MREQAPALQNGWVFQPACVYYSSPVDAARDNFLDVRTHGFARVAVCVPRTRVADPVFNTAAHLEQLEAA